MAQLTTRKYYYFVHMVGVGHNFYESSYIEYTKLTGGTQSYLWGIAGSNKRIANISDHKHAIFGCYRKVSKKNCF